MKDHIKSLEGEIQLLRDEIKGKSLFISSLISSKSLGNKYCESNNSKIPNDKKTCLQELENENITPMKISKKKAEEGSEPTQNVNKMKATSLPVSVYTF